jgi:hypothetical protein
MVIFALLTELRAFSKNKCSPCISQAHKHLNVFFKNTEKTKKTKHSQKHKKPKKIQIFFKNIKNPNFSKKHQKIQIFFKNTKNLKFCSKINLRSNSPFLRKQHFKTKIGKKNGRNQSPRLE